VVVWSAETRDVVTEGRRGRVAVFGNDTSAPPGSRYGAGAGCVAHDPDTVAYFDARVPEYSVSRLSDAVAFIAGGASRESSLIDVGCGAGNALAYLRAHTDIERLAGLDVSARCLEQTQRRVRADLYEGSILDRGFISRLPHDFDFAVIAAVLHHLVGHTRAASRAYAVEAIRNAISLLRPGGHVLVVEPAFYPPRVMDGVFWIKRTASRVTKRRIGILGYWNNIGAPVVSYYTNEELRIIVDQGGADLVAMRARRAQLSPVVGWLIRKTDTTLIAKRPTRIAPAVGD
jgi:SAM-dependent methyltransferase